MISTEDPTEDRSTVSVKLPSATLQLSSCVFVFVF